MADKRIYQLSTATDITDKFFQIDKSGQANAERYPMSSIVSAVQETDVTTNTNWGTGYKTQFGDGNEFKIYFGANGAILEADQFYIDGNVTLASDVWLGSNDAGATWDGTAYVKTQSFGDNSTKVASTAFVQAALNGAYRAAVSEALLSGDNTVTFSTPFEAGVSYTLWYIAITNSGSYETRGVLSNRVVASFDINVDEDCTMEYVATRVL
jgi:hypothetical protein